MSSLKITPVVLCILIGGCSTSEKQIHPEAQWYGQMHRLSDAHQRLMPLAANTKVFSDPRQQNLIEKNIKEMVLVSENLVGDPKAPNSDPIISYTALAFEADVKAAHVAYNSNDFSKSRATVLKLGNHCIACHSRSDQGVRDFPLKWKPQLTSLSQVQKLEFLLANRQYSSATKLALELAADKNSAEQDPFVWKESLKKALAVLVRVTKSPQDANKIAKAVADNKGAPYYIRREAEEWKKDISLWSKEGSPLTDEAKFAAAKKLLQKSYSQQFRINDGAYISNLRASGFLHQIMMSPNSKIYEQALLYSGQSAMSLNETALALYYFETCIKELPHSRLAEFCFEEYQSAIRKSNPYYEDSSAEVGKLNRLQKLSTAKEPGDSPSRIDNMESSRDRDYETSN